MKISQPTRAELERFFMNELVKVTLYDEEVLYGTLIKCKTNRKNYYELENQKGLDGKLAFRVRHIKNIEIIKLDTDDRFDYETAGYDIGLDLYEMEVE